MNIFRLKDHHYQSYHSKIADLEKIASYPLGDDFFKIDHGKDYFAFFRRLGRLYYFMVELDESPIAVGAGMVRKLPVFKNKTKNFWYFADLKVHPSHRGSHIPLAMMNKFFIKHYLICPRGYAISMNESGTRKNRVLKIIQRFKWIPISSPGILNIYSLSCDEMMSFEKTLKNHRGELSYLSLSGIKDIVLQSTGKAMPLIHVQFGPAAEKGYQKPQEKSVHMFCSMESSMLDQECQKQGLKPSATATLICHRMKKANWDFILTSDI